MPRFDYKCPRCEQITERFLPVGQDIPQRCVNDGVLMEKLPAAPAFAVHGFNAKNGYAGGK